MLVLKDTILIDKAPYLDVLKVYMKQEGENLKSFLERLK